MSDQFILVAIGGGLGSICRFAISELTSKRYKGGFPAGTFIANILGCLVIGILSTKLYLNSDVDALGVIGFCGGFTTFSSFSKETFLLLDKKEIKLAFAYLLTSLTGGIVAVYLGYIIGK